MNNITLYFTLNNITIEPYFNKYKCKINNDNECIKQRLINLERLLLNKYNNIKQKTFKLQEQLNNNNLKLFSNKPIDNAKHSHINVIIKISGIWESITEIGLIYKLILV
jgi:hypothetical protein